MPPMILISAMLKMGVTSRYAKAAAWVVIGLAAIALAYAAFVIYVHNAQKRAVEADRTETTIETQKRTIEADRAAEAAKQARDDADGKRADELRNEAAKGDATVAGPGTVGVLDKLRREQAARNRNTPSR